MNPNPDTWFFFQDLPLTEAGEQYKQLLELRSGGDRPNFDEAFNFWNSFPTAERARQLHLGAWTRRRHSCWRQERLCWTTRGRSTRSDLDPQISDFERQAER